MPLTAFVTDGDQRPALTIVRALAQRGVRVVVGADEPVSLASESRYCAWRVTYPSPYHDRSGFDQFVRDFVARKPIDVVLPVTDVTTHAICTHRSDLSRHCALAVPSLEAFELVSNKARLMDFAARCGVPVPQTRVVENRAGLSDIAHRLHYPVVVKPMQSRLQTIEGWIRASVQYADSSRALERLYDTSPHLRSHPSLVQQRIDGEGVGMFVLFDRGTIVAEFAHRRLREKPPSGGASVLSESVEVDPCLREYARRVLGSIGWHGVAMMEYKRDRRTGECVLMEVNGRFWGSLELAVRAGIDFPYLTFQLARGLRPMAPPAYELAVKNRWMLGDLDHLLLRMFRSKRTLDLPDAAPSTFRTAVEFFRMVEPKLHYEVISTTDWRPFRHELARYARGLCESVWLRRPRRAMKPDEPILAIDDR